MFYSLTPSGSSPFKRGSGIVFVISLFLFLFLIPILILLPYH